VPPCPPGGAVHRVDAGCGPGAEPARRRAGLARGRPPAAHRTAGPLCGGRRGPMAD